MRLLADHMRKANWLRVCVLLVTMAFHTCMLAQPPAKLYTVKNGKMYIHLSKQLKVESVDSFISQYELQPLALKRFFLEGFVDSLKKYGWEIIFNNNTGLTITKPLSAFDNFNDPSERIRLGEKKSPVDDGFAPVSSKVQYGINKFKDKYPFLVRDSIVTFYLKNNLSAKKVMLAGSFNQWDPAALSMQKTDSGWIADVKLAPGKYWYKFIIDGSWITDPENRYNENDGRGNTNSVYFFTNTVFRLEGFLQATKVYLAGSFNDWDKGHLALIRKGNGWELPVYLANGTHTYRFIVDGVWYMDPANKEKLPNEFNDYNSVIRIGTPIRFRLNGYSNAKEVILAGSFNKWKKHELFMKKAGNGWELDYTLGPGNYEYKVIVDGNVIPESQNLITVNDKPGENSTIILEANYTFRLKGFAQANKIFLAGDFNEWNPATMPMRKEGDEWVFRVHLSPGKHLYKFIVDGNWIIDPGNKLWEENEFGTGNSVIWIGN